MSRRWDLHAPPVPDGGLGTGGDGRRRAHDPAPAQGTGAGKTLRIAAGEADGPSGTIDPAFSTADPDAARISLVLERLVVLDDTFAPQPQLTESWSSNETADEWTFQLRKGVKFHEGAELSSEDVLYTYKRLIDPATGSPGTPSFTAIGSVNAVDAHAVRFKLKQPVVEFPAYIANRFAYIVRAGQPAEDIRTKAIGTGPFKVQRFVPGEEPSVFVKHDAYWRPEPPKV